MKVSIIRSNDKVMKWDILIPSPMTFLKHSFQIATISTGKDFPDRLQHDWLFLYDSRLNRGRDPILMQIFDTMDFSRAAAILDLAVADYGSLQFAGSQLAAAVFYISYLDSEDSMGKIFIINH